MDKKKKKIYSEGIFFRCTGCGTCCSRPEGWVEMTGEELERAAAALNISSENFRKKFTSGKKEGKYLLKNRPDGACVFLDKDNRCEIYDYRPLHCRTFPFWPENLKNSNRWKQVKEGCPGIGNGDYYSAEQIRDTLKLQRKRKK
jgi:Fe-S-cluster containining protein